VLFCLGFTIALADNKAGIFAGVVPGRIASEAVQYTLLGFEWRISFPIAAALGANTRRRILNAKSAAIVHLFDAATALFSALSRSCRLLRGCRNRRIDGPRRQEPLRTHSGKVQTHQTRYVGSKSQRHILHRLGWTCLAISPNAPGTLPPKALWKLLRAIIPTITMKTRGANPPTTAHLSFHR